MPPLTDAAGPDRRDLLCGAVALGVGLAGTLPVFSAGPGLVPLKPFGKSGEKVSASAWVAPRSAGRRAMRKPSGSSTRRSTPG